MQQTILVNSTDQALVRDIVAHFEESNSFRVTVAGSDEEVLNQVASRKTDVVILDGEGRTSPLSGFINDLVSIQPGIKIFLFPPQNNPLHPELEEITVSVMLQRPFSPKELDAFLEIIFGGNDEDFTFDYAAEDKKNNVEDEEEEDLVDFIGETELQNLNAMLSNMPAPDPGLRSDSHGSAGTDENLVPLEETLQPAEGEEQEIESMWVRQDASTLPDIQPVQEALTEEGSEPASQDQPEIEHTGEDENPSQPESTLPQESSSDSEDIKTGLGLVSEPLIIESVSPVSQNPHPGTSPLGVKSVRFEYYCVLIPDNPNQFLARDLSDRLGFILPQIHISQGWRVTSLSVRPLFLMWQISLPADTCPADAVNEIRQRTTSHFYTNFPELLNRNNEADFWAPGYLILSGPQAPSASLVETFIQRTRSAQQSKSG